MKQKSKIVKKKSYKTQREDEKKRADIVHTAKQRIVSCYDSTMNMNRN